MNEPNELNSNEIKKISTSPQKKMKKSNHKKTKEKEKELLSEIKKLKDEDNQMKVENEVECLSPKVDLNKDVMVTSPLKLEEGETDSKNKDLTAKKSKENPEKKNKLEVL